MRALLFLSMVLLSAPAVAEVFKCTEKYGKIIYQNVPCKSTAKEQQLDIKADPTKEAEAKAKLESIRQEYDIRKAAQAEEDKALASQRNEALSLEYARRSAIAQQEQAQAQQRQAEALENQNQNNNRAYLFWPVPNRHLADETVRSPLNPPLLPPKPPNPPVKEPRLFPFKPK